jgi:hypothetical protein
VRRNREPSLQVPCRAATQRGSECEPRCTGASGAKPEARNSSTPHSTRGSQWPVSRISSRASEAKEEPSSAATWNASRAASQRPNLRSTRPLKYKASAY